ncbi:MAG: ABC transporter permease [Candidatus Doudnabacteria bacterium]|nr:ABC transporter permease [Candidatus Doudnabacteria bacterium]
MIKMHRVWGYMLRHLYEIAATYDRKFDIVFWPTIDLFIFGFLSVYVQQTNSRAGIAGAIVGALILWDLAFNIQRDITITLLEDAWSRNLYNMYSTPLKISEIILGTLLLATFKAFITVALITFLAWQIFGFSFASVGFDFIFYLLNIFIFGWAFGCMTASLIFRFGMKLQIFTWSLLAAIYPISGVYYPVSILPGWAEVLSRFLPLSYVFEGLRGILIFGQPQEGASQAVILGLNFIYLGIGIMFFYLGFRNAKNRGWFIHPT